MKKLVLSVALLALAAAPAFANDNQTLAIAKQAVNECIQNAKQAGYDVNGGVETTGICFVSGETKKVTFWGNPKCQNGPTPCMQMSVIVATVDLGCENEVVGTTCNFMTK